MSNCIFCKIVDREIPATIIYEDEKTLAFNDISPKAPVHILVIPKKHLVSIEDLPLDETELLADLMIAVYKIIKEMNLYKYGYRLVINSGRDGGQEVLHLHAHILAGRPLLWPPG